MTESERTPGLTTDSVGVGWEQLVRDLDSDLRLLAPGYSVSQLKEKFGTLRYYIALPSHLGVDVVTQVYQRIRDAEEQSGSTCEVCGRTAELRRDLRWHRTLCPEHYHLRRANERRKHADDAGTPTGGRP